MTSLKIIAIPPPGDFSGASLTSECECLLLPIIAIQTIWSTRTKIEQWKSCGRIVENSALLNDGSLCHSSGMKLGTLLNKKIEIPELGTRKFAMTPLERRQAINRDKGFGRSKWKQFLPSNQKPKDEKEPQP